MEMSDILREGDSILICSLLTRYDDYVLEFKTYSRAYEDMVAVGGFEYCTKAGRYGIIVGLTSVVEKHFDPIHHLLKC